MNNIETTILIIETFLVLWAIFHDFLARTIPNELNAAIFVFGFIYACLSAHPLFAFLWAGIWFLAFLAIGILGFIGMGDVKLIPGILLCVNPNAHVQIFLVMVIGMLGGVLGCYYLSAYWIIRLFKLKPKYRRPNFSMAARWRAVEFYRMSKKAGIPYGFAIGLGGIFTMWLFR